MSARRPCDEKIGTVMEPSNASSDPISLTPEPDPEPITSRRRIGYFFTLTAVLLLMGGWFYLIFVYDPGLMIDELADQTFPTQAEKICSAALSQTEKLPVANLASTPTERAANVEKSNIIFREMIESLRPISPQQPQQIADGVREWLNDWDTYIGNREEYALNLRKDPEARFLETTKGSSTKGITRAINGFAKVNRMESCTTPADLS